MSTRIFVGGLAYKTSEKRLKEVFSAFGDVISGKIVKDQDSGKTQGFAFIVMEAAEDAQKAMTVMNGKDLDGRKLKVNQAYLQTVRS